MTSVISTSTGINEVAIISCIADLVFAIKHWVEMRSNKKRNFFSFSRKGGIYKAGMPKNHNMHDKAQAPPPPQKHLES